MREAVVGDVPTLVELMAEFYPGVQAKLKPLTKNQEVKP